MSITLSLGDKTIFQGTLKNILEQLPNTFLIRRLIQDNEQYKRAVAFPFNQY